MEQLPGMLKGGEQPEAESPGEDAAEGGVEEPDEEER